MDGMLLKVNRKNLKFQQYKNFFNYNKKHKIDLV